MSITARGLLLTAAALVLMSFGGTPSAEAATTIVMFNEHEATEGPLTAFTIGAPGSVTTTISGNQERATVRLDGFLKATHASFNETFVLTEPAAEGGGTSDWINFQSTKNNTRLTIIFQSDFEGTIPPPPGHVFATDIERAPYNVVSSLTSPPPPLISTLPVTALPPNVTAAFAAGNSLTVTAASIVPEPSSLALAGVGGLALAGCTWRRRRRA